MIRNSPLFLIPSTIMTSIIGPVGILRTSILLASQAASLYMPTEARSTHNVCSLKSAIYIHERLWRASLSAEGYLAD